MTEPDALLSAPELDALCQQTIEELEAEIERYDETLALQAEAIPTNTTENAIAALNRKERFAGEHEVARAWLIHHAPDRPFFYRGVDNGE